MRNIVFLFLCLFFLFSCDSGTDPSGGTPGRVTAGSSFVFATAEYDSLGNVIAGSESTFTMTVEQTGQALLGKTNVVVLRNSRDTSAGYFCYEDNGDISSYENYYVSFGQVAPMWIRYPIASRQTIALPPINETSGTNHYTWGGTLAYDSTGTITVNGKALECIRIKRLETGSQTGSAPRLFNELRQYWFAGELGFFTRFQFTSTDRDTNNDPIDFFSTITELKSYALK